MNEERIKMLIDKLKVCLAVSLLLLGLYGASYAGNATLAGEDAPLPNIAFEIMDGYDVAAKSLFEQIRDNWTEVDLQVEDNMYGEKWSREFTLRVIREHEIHHRGQMTILMRQAGLVIPGLFGASKEEWAKFGMVEPKI